MKIVSIIIVLVFFASGTAEIRRRVEQKEQDKIEVLKNKVSILQNKLDEIKAARWQDKRNSVVKKEAFKEVWDDLKRSIDHLAVTKDQKDELLFKMKAQVDQQEGKNEELASLIGQLDFNFKEKLGELEGIIEGGFPHNTSSVMMKYNNLQADYEKAKQVNADFFSRVFDLHKDLFLVGETREVTRDRFVFVENSVAKEKGVESLPSREAALSLRIGSVYKAQISTETDNTAILAKSGMLGKDAWRYIEGVTPEVAEDLAVLKNRIINKDYTTPLLVPIDVVLKKAIGAGYVNSDDSQFFKQLGAELRAAGFAIYLIGFAFAGSFFIVVRKLIVFYKNGRGGKKVYHTVQGLVTAGKFKEAIAFCDKKNTSTSRALGKILKNRDKSRETVEEILYEYKLEEVPHYEKGINTINIFAAAAPLAGLLGTVTGMVALFGAITLHGTGDPKIMASGISEAMLSTKWGLLAAIPLLLIYSYFNNWSNKLIGDLEVYSAKLINDIYN